MSDYLGTIIMELNGVEIDVASLSPSVKTGRKLVKTMNSTGRAKGFAEGIKEYDLKVTVPIPLTGDLDWEAIANAKITIHPQVAGGKRTSYIGCFAIDVGEKYQVEGEAVRDISMGALRKVIE